MQIYTVSISGVIELRRALLLLKTVLKDQARSLDFLLILILLLAYYSFYYKTGGSIAKNGERINVLAPFSISFLSRDFKLITYCGLIMVISDIFNRKKNLMFHIVRMNVKEWYYEQILCLVVEVIGYFLVVLLMQMIFYYNVLSISGSWGSGIENGTYFTGAMYIDESLLGMNVITAFLRAFVLSCALGLLFGCICMLADVMAFRKIGPVICLALLVWNLIINNSTQMLPKVFSPVGMVESYTDESFLAAMAVFAVEIVLLMGIIRIRIHRGLRDSLV